MDSLDELYREAKRRQHLRIQEFRSRNFTMKIKKRVSGAPNSALALIHQTSRQQSHIQRVGEHVGKATLIPPVAVTGELSHPRHVTVYGYTVLPALV